MALDQNVPAVANQIATDLIAMNANWEEVVAQIAAKVNDTAYAASWDAVVDVAPSKNAVYDKIQAILTASENLLIATTGTKMWFYQNVAPTGWTIDSTPADAVLAVKGGTQAYNVNGGNQAGTWTQSSHTLTTADIPAHDHGSQQPAITVVEKLYTGGLDAGIEKFVTVDTCNSPVLDAEGVCIQVTATQAAHTHTSVGSGGAHSHGGTTYRPLAQVGIIATKD